MLKLFERGYSLIESLIYLLMLSIIATIAIPLLSLYRNHLSLEMTASEIQMFLMKQKFLALSTNRRYRIHFLPSMGVYYSEMIDYCKAQRKNPPVLYLPSNVFFGTGSVKGPPAHPRKHPRRAVTFPHGYMSVGADGKWSTPGTIYLTNNSGEHAAISVSIAGRIRIWWWNEKSHKWT